MVLELRECSKSFGGEQRVYFLQSKELSCATPVSVFIPPPSFAGLRPTLLWLSGITCTDENFRIKAGAQRMAAELGLIIVAPDTSLRGDGVPDDPAKQYDFGFGASFSLDATEPPWDKHYRMKSYLENELINVLSGEVPIDSMRLGIFGHSMGGHGALTIALRNPDTYKSVSAVAPIVAPSNCSLGRRAFEGYLGSDKRDWRKYDACALIEDGARVNEILVDQGRADSFLEEQLKVELLSSVCAKHNQPLNLRMHEGYDHSYYFVASVIDDHLKWHAQRLG